MTCIRCQGLMVEDQLFDFQGTYGFTPVHTPVADAK